MIVFGGENSVMRTHIRKSGVLISALLCFIAPSSWADSASYPAFGFGPTPSAGTSTPGIGNVAVVSNVPVIQVRAAIAFSVLLSHRNDKVRIKLARPVVFVVRDRETKANPGGAADLGIGPRFETSFWK